MPHFRYKAVNAAGDVLEGEMEALSRQALVERLHPLLETPAPRDVPKMAWEDTES